MKSFSHLEDKLNKRKVDGNYRRLFLSDDDLIDFSSNDYLGLARDSRKLNLQGAHGSGGSRLLSGNSKKAEQLESFLADFHQSESALLFNSGYTANLGFFSTIPQRGDIILYDDRIHASVKDGMRLGLAKHYSFKHNDVEALSEKLERFKGANVFVAVEAVYSMDGDVAPLEQLVALCEEYDASLMVDEAHSVGVFGDQGQGLVQSLGLHDRVPFRVVTFGKAIGAHGASVLCVNTVKEYLINYSRAFIYSTALPEVAIETIRKNYIRMQSGIEVKALRELIDYYASVIKVGVTPSAIQIIPVEGNEAVERLSKRLYKEKLDIRPVKSPTVPIGEECLRVCLHVYNSIDQLALLKNTLQKLSIS
jgi:8-amino-7-oxononanoate synthase